MTPAPISVERLRELLAKATPDWRLARNGVVTGGPFHEYPRGSAQSQLAMFCHMADDEAWQEANAELAVAAVNAMPALLQQLAEREADLEREQGVREDAQRQLRAAERAREEAIDRIIAGLSEYGESVCQYEFGLPDYDEHIEAMRNIVRSALAASGGSNG